MDVSGINNNINSELTQLSSQQQANRTSSSQEISKSDDFLKLSVAEYNTKRDELSQSLQAYNEGIGVTKVAQNGLEKQQDFIKNIENTLTKVRDDESFTADKNSIKNDLNKELLNFKNTAADTKYKRESLLAQDMYEDKEISISTREAYFSIEKPNTPDIAVELSNEIAQSDFNNPEALQNTINKVSSTQNQLQNLTDEFTDLGNKLEDSAKVSIKDQIDLSNQNKVNANVNFGKEMTDFTKSNIQANVGYLAASQANIVQEQSVRLLS